MKKVIIKCISNYNFENKYHIIIFDKYNNKIYDEHIKYGKIQLFLNEGTYKVLVAPLDIYSSILFTSFIVKDEINYYNFYINKTINSLKITAILVDKNYENLPIERGEIKLWRNHIQ